MTQTMLGEPVHLSGHNDALSQLRPFQLFLPSPPPPPPPLPQRPLAILRGPACAFASPHQEVF